MEVKNLELGRKLEVTIEREDRLYHLNSDIYRHQRQYYLCFSDIGAIWGAVPLPPGG